MPVDLKKFLASKEEYPDGTKITLANGVEVTLKDLRDFDTAREDEVRAKQTELAGREQQLGTLAEQVAAARAALEAKGNENPAPADIAQAIVDRIQAAAGDRKIDIFKEPGDNFKPLVDRIAELDLRDKTRDDYIKNTRTELEKYLTYDNKRQILRDYRSFKEWPKDFDVKKAVQYATQNRLLDEMGYPDFDRVYEAVTAPVRQAADLDKEREKIRGEERTKARKEAADANRPRDAFVPTPGATGGGTQAKPKYKGIESIPDWDILNDPEIQATFNGSGGN